MACDGDTLIGADGCISIKAGLLSSGWVDSLTFRTQYTNELFDIPNVWANAPADIELLFHCSTLLIISSMSCLIIISDF